MPARRVIPKSKDTARLRAGAEQVYDTDTDDMREHDQSYELEHKEPLIAQRYDWLELLRAEE